MPIKDHTGAVLIKSAVGNPYLFTAREYDAEAWMYFYRARYYDWLRGAFIHEDPVGFLGGNTNLYATVSANPVNLVDPYGLWTAYGNWGGPDWTGGQLRPYESLTGKQKQCLAPPIDSMDEAFKRHDLAYSAVRVALSKALESIKKNLSLSERERKIAIRFQETLFEKAKDTIDGFLYQRLKALNNDPTLWPHPAPDPGLARFVRKKAIPIFNIQKRL